MKHHAIMQHLVWKVLFWCKELPQPPICIVLNVAEVLNISSEEQLPPLSLKVSLGSSQVISEGV